MHWVVIILILLFGGCVYCEKELADMPPSVVTKTEDGCTVYSFRAHYNTHYFTRCPEKTTTTSRRCSTRPPGFRHCRDENIETPTSKGEPTT